MLIFKNYRKLQPLQQNPYPYHPELVTITILSYFVSSLKKKKSYSAWQKLE